MADRRLAVQGDTLLADPAAEVCGLDRLRFFDPAAEQAWEYRWTHGKRRWVGGPAIYAALVHPGNTSRKTTAGSRWHRIPLDVVTREMGRDWDFYARPVETGE
jgi:hypothetical protein